MTRARRPLIRPGLASEEGCLPDVLDYLAGGMTEDEILADFPQLSRDSIRACLAYAADRERRLVPSRAA